MLTSETPTAGALAERQLGDGCPRVAGAITNTWRFPADVKGWLSEAEGRALAGLARGGRVLEVGSYHGRSTVCMAQTAREVVAIDWGRGDEGAGFEPSTEALLANLAAHGVRERVQVLVARSEEAGPSLPDASFDLVFVDAAHDDASVLADLELARRVVRPGGTIALHDCQYEGVRAAALRALGWDLGGPGGTTVDSLHHRPYWPPTPGPAGYLFLALPRRPGYRPPGEEPGHLRLTKPVLTGHFRVSMSCISLLCYAFNKLWATAMNSRPGADRWAMQHDDVQAPAGWADVLEAERAAHGAAVCSAVVAIKDRRGLTSTAVRDGDTGETRRLTLAEVHRLPETFGLEDVTRTLWGRAPRPSEMLAVNTGLWVCRLDAAWVERFAGFAMTDGVRRGDDGLWRAGVLPEDWQFSEWLWSRGQKVVATRKVPTAHLDAEGKEHRNDVVWGEWQADLGDDHRPAAPPAPALSLAG